MGKPDTEVHGNTEGACAHMLVRWRAGKLDTEMHGNTEGARADAGGGGG